MRRFIDAGVVGAELPRSTPRPMPRAGSLAVKEKTGNCSLSSPDELTRSLALEAINSGLSLIEFSPAPISKSHWRERVGQVFRSIEVN